MKKVVENLVMVGDELYQLAEYKGVGEECEECPLCNTCGDFSHLLSCNERSENGNPMYYKRLGTLAELAKERDERAMARHYTAVLMQHNRWRRDNSALRKQVDALEVGRAIDFAVNELKEKYKKL